MKVTGILRRLLLKKLKRGDDAWEQSVKEARIAVGAESGVVSPGFAEEVQEVILSEIEAIRHSINVIRNVLVKAPQSQVKVPRRRRRVK
jgi:hypothetical protein